MMNEKQILQLIIRQHGKCDGCSVNKECTICPITHMCTSLIETSFTSMKQVEQRFYEAAVEKCAELYGEESVVEVLL